MWLAPARLILRLHPNTHVLLHRRLANALALALRLCFLHRRLAYALALALHLRLLLRLPFSLLRLNIAPPLAPPNAIARKELRTWCFMGESRVFMIIGVSGPGGAEVQVKQVHGAIHQGYASRAEADAAFVYAVERDWVMVRPRTTHTAVTPAVTLPTPTPSDDPQPNPLHGATASAPHWHVVYAGIAPGIYASYLECALNTLGLSSASYEAARSREEAVEHWLHANADGSVRVLTHSYYV
ncbi:hypothetical protein C8R46DRAFT_1217110 [Mycena filopes]|nr:hypothetical protein C8R46DRAFT_1217110 [Mycena filopes]